MINKDQIDKFVNELIKTIVNGGYNVQTVSYKGNEFRVDVTLLVDNKQDLYIIYDDMGVNRWMRVYVEGMAK